MDTKLLASNIRNAKKDPDGWYNCWGFTQYALGATKELDWVEGEDMEYWLSENTKLVKTQKDGDILVFRDVPDQSGELLHTAIYFKGKIYQKRGGCPFDITDSVGNLLKRDKNYGYFTEIRRLL